MPFLDSSFGNARFARIGVPTTANETPTATSAQADGKLLVGGQSIGRTSRNFVVRFNRGGSLDSTFGRGGVAYFVVPGQLYLYEVDQDRRSFRGHFAGNVGRWPFAVIVGEHDDGILILSLLPAIAPEERRAAIAEGGIEAAVAIEADHEVATRTPDRLAPDQQLAVCLRGRRGRRLVDRGRHPDAREPGVSKRRIEKRHGERTRDRKPKREQNVRNQKRGLVSRRIGNIPTL